MVTKSKSQVLEEARIAAKKIEDDLAEAVILAEELRSKYISNPLKINVPFWGAILTGQFRIISDKRSWSAKKGLEVSRALGSGKDSTGRTLPDREELSNKLILQAGKPDINYVWFVDIVRTIQLWFNFFGQWFGYEVPLLDKWGSVFYEVRGGPTCFIELVNEPQSTADLIQKYAETLQKADQAFTNLVSRAQKQGGG